jgi:radical SAM superfamily enzyme YgiQ (UPF0313 family)
MIDICLLNPRTETTKTMIERKKTASYLGGVMISAQDDIRELPNGLLILAAILESWGYLVEIVDCSIIEDDIEFLKSNLHKYRLLGVTALTNTIERSLELVKFAKTINPDLYIIMGGPHASFEYTPLLNEIPELDAICIGEAENSFPWLVEKLLKKPSIDLKDRDNDTLLIDQQQLSKKYRKLNTIFGNYKEIPPGIVFRAKNTPENSEGKDTIEFKIKTTGFPPAIDLTKIPLPARHLVEMNYSVANILVNRGCPNQCSFCSRSKLFPKVRIRPLDSIMEELTQILHYPNYRFVNFYDNINLKPSFFRDFLNALIDRKFPIPWGAEMRVDLITPEEAKLLKKSKCKLIATGIESADETVLKTNFKFQNTTKVVEGIHRLKAEGLGIQAYFVLGLPGETEESFEKTLALVKNLPLESGKDIIEFFITTPYPGSDLAQNPNKYGLKIFSQEYSHYNCREIHAETETLNKQQIQDMQTRAMGLKRVLGL